MTETFNHKEQKSIQMDEAYCRIFFNTSKSRKNKIAIALFSAALNGKMPITLETLMEYWEVPKDLSLRERVAYVQLVIINDNR